MMGKNNLKIFVVNLKKDTIKKDYMEELCNNYSLNVEFIEAIYGKDLSKDELNEIYDAKLSKQYLGRELTFGEIGCALSHINIYKRMINENIDKALIFEDDINFDKTLYEIFTTKKIPLNFDLLLLGHHAGYNRNIDTQGSFWNKIGLFKNTNIEYPVERAYGTYGYIITLEGAKKLINKLKKIIKPIDHYTGNKKYINLYIVNPPIIKINDTLSDEFTSMQYRNNDSMIFKIRNFKDFIRLILIKLKLIKIFFKFRAFIIQFNFFKKY